MRKILYVIEVFDAIIHISKANIWNGVPVPEAFRPACMQLLSGKTVGERKTGQTPGKEFGLFFAVFHSARYLTDAYGGINLVRGDGDSPTSAADVVCEAFAAKNVDLKCTRVRDWLTVTTVTVPIRSRGHAAVTTVTTPYRG